MGVASAGPDVDFASADEDTMAAAMEAFGEQLVPLLEALVASATDAVSDDVATIDAVLRAGMETGDSPTSAPDFVAADAGMDAWMTDNCGFDVQTVTAVEYAFEDTPETLSAGINGFEFDNQGNEVHEMILFRINDDVDETVEELLALPEEEAMTKTRFIGVAFAAPGGSDTTFLELEAGRYAMLCFVPVGTVDMSALEGEEMPEGQRHFTQGMVAQFEVT